MKIFKSHMNENEYSQQNHFNSIQSWFYLNELLLNLKTIPSFFFHAEQRILKYLFNYMH